jgi:glycosyltransferase involved in cell wall biosynthesis
MESLSVIIPAYNEVKNLRAAYENTIKALAKVEVLDYEIIIITNDRRDGTNDGTPAIGDQIAKENPHVIRIHNPYVNLGYKFRQGVKKASKDFVTWIPGDNETVESSIADIFSHLGEADMVVTYTANKYARPWKRRFVSRCFTILCNALFCLNLKYYNGICIYPRKILQTVPMVSDNFAYMAEVIIYMIKSGIRYIEVPMEIKPTTVSASFKFMSVIEALGTLLSLFWKINFLRKKIDVSVEII